MRQEQTSALSRSQELAVIPLAGWPPAIPLSRCKSNPMCRRKHEPNGQTSYGLRQLLREFHLTCRSRNRRIPVSLPALHPADGPRPLPASHSSMYPCRPNRRQSLPLPIRSMQLTRQLVTIRPLEGFYWILVSGTRWREMPARCHPWQRRATDSLGWSQNNRTSLGRSSQDSR